jgi:ribosomal protein L32
MDCKNCSLSIQTHHNFCPSCGAKVIRNRLTIKSLFSHFSEQFLNYDNKFLKTFTHLTTKPEAVIGCYVDGTRKKYVNVISYFAIALTLSGFQMFIVNKFFPEVMNVDFLPQNGSENIQEQNMNFVQEYQSILYMLTVPIYAMMSKIVFFNRKEYNYTEHLVVNMYLAAHLSIISTIIVITTSALGLNFGIIGLFTIPLQILFSAYCFKRLFELSFKTILLKTIFFILILIIVFIILSIFSAIAMYFNGSFEEFKKAKMNAA